MNFLRNLSSRLRVGRAVPLGATATATTTILGVSAFGHSPSLGQEKKQCSPKFSESEESVHDMVSDYYGEQLSGTEDLKTTACCPAAAPPKRIQEALKLVPDEIKARYYGCGSPLPFGIEGKTVLDLGSGSGQDCYVAAQLVGESGNVIGVDMTDKQLALARKHARRFCRDTLGFKRENLRFVKGYIEELGELVEAESVDVVISNCVVNLSPRKDRVLSGVHHVLRKGGEFYFSDVYCDRRLDDAIRKHPTLVGECLGGALYIEDFRRTCQATGFTDPRVLSSNEIQVKDPALKKLLGNARFYSITYRLFKVDLEDRCEDYGQVAVYKGTIKEHPHSYQLDDHHTFYTNKPMLVCSNSANMVGNQSWLAPHFRIIGDTSGDHFGLFDCSAAPADASGGPCC